MEIKPEEVHLFSGDELLKYLTQLNFFDTSYLDNIPDDINWFADNVSQIQNINISNLYAFELEDGSGLLEFKVRAKLVMNDNKLSFNLVYLQ